MGRARDYAGARWDVSFQRHSCRDSDASIAANFGYAKTVRGADLHNISAVLRQVEKLGFCDTKVLVIVLKCFKQDQISGEEFSQLCEMMRTVYCESLTPTLKGKYFALGELEALDRVVQT